MRRKPWLCLIVLLCASTAAGEEPPLQSGLWEVTITTERVAPPTTIPGAPPMTTQHCITAGEASSIAPPISKESDRCRVVCGGRTGNVMNYVVNCKDDDFRAHARYTYSGTTYEGIVDTKVSGVETRQIFRGRRIGDCDTPTAAP
jgi:hypothetical protein